MTGRTILPGLAAALGLAVAILPAAARAAELSAVARLGKLLFHDPALSSSGRLSCAGCHAADRAYAPDNGLAVQRGGPHLASPGLRAVPSLTYLFHTPPFSVGPDSSGENEAPPAPLPLAAQPTGQAKAAAPVAAVPALVPQGGFFRDGRADTLEEQALGPLLSGFEMDNLSPAALAERLRRAPYAGRFAALFGSGILADPARLVAEATFALGRYQMEDRAFHAFTSKYDSVLSGRARLSPAEARGRALFDDPKKGGCAACHPDKPGRDGSPPMFTDYQFEALGVPRNPDIPANADPGYFDLGLCGPPRNDAYSRQKANCGLFKTPSLRNAATRRVFFHNGRFRSLKEVVAFYVERDTNPGKWYPRRPDGTVDKFDDLPPRYRGNVDVVDPPMNRKPGDRPALTPAEIDDVVAFLHTLTDAYSP